MARKYEKYIPPQFGQDKVLEILMKFRPPLIIALVTIMISTIGYMLISKVDLFKAFYMTILTVTTIGYGEMWDMTVKDRLFNILVMTLGVGSVMGYSIAVLINIVTSGEIKELLGFRKMVKDIEALKGHYIICGFNNCVPFLVRELKKKRIPFVIVSDKDIGNFIRENEVRHYLFLDPTDEKTFYLANIESAVGAIVADEDDYRTLTITLTVKNVVNELGIKEFFVFSVVNDAKFKNKVRKVGANVVETIPEIISKRIVAIAQKPPVFGEKSFLVDMLFGEETPIDIEEFLVDSNSSFIGKSLADLNIKGVKVIVLKKADGKVIYMPEDSEIIESGDVLVIVGSKKILEKLSSLLVKRKVASSRYYLRKLLKERDNGMG